VYTSAWYLDSSVKARGLDLGEAPPCPSFNEAGGHRGLEKHTDLLHINLMYKFIVASERLHLVYSPILQH
jgi:hypothetical protein